jgi:phosphoenolpyruvate carboxylase
MQVRIMRSDRAGEETEIDAMIKREIRILWPTRMMREVRIHVADEIENAVAVFAHTFLSELPKAKRRLARMFGFAGATAPYLRPGSWVGGDRDGNPFVPAETLDRALGRQSETVLDYYLDEVHRLGTELSLSDAYAGVDPALKRLAVAPERVSIHQLDEPYRRALITVYARLAATREALVGRGPARPPNWRTEPYNSPCDFEADLDAIIASLTENGDADIAEGRLMNLREAAGAFGFHLAVVDIRQNADVHERALDELFAAGAGISYSALSEPERVKLLAAEKHRFGMFAHTIGIDLARRKIVIVNLVYNFSRLVSGWRAKQRRQEPNRGREGIRHEYRNRAGSYCRRKITRTALHRLRSNQFRRFFEAFV